MKVTKITPVHKSNEKKNLTETFDTYYFNNPRKWQIFLDLDGVICNFNERFEEFMHETPKEFEYKYGTEEFQEAVLEHGTEFWAKMNWTADGKELWHFLRKYGPNILTKPLDPDKSVKGKMEWIIRNLGKDVSFNFAQDKSIYATPNSILIDDNPDWCYDFRKAGGKAILFKDSISTINVLKKVYNLQ